jgi:hypothetical protein
VHLFGFYYKNIFWVSNIFVLQIYCIFSKVGIYLLNTVPVDLLLCAFVPFLFCNKECYKKCNSKFKEAVMVYLCCW